MENHKFAPNEAPSYKALPQESDTVYSSDGKTIKAKRGIDSEIDLEISIDEDELRRELRRSGSMYDLVRLMDEEERTLEGDHDEDEYADRAYYELYFPYNLSSADYIKWLNGEYRADLDA